MCSEPERTDDDGDCEGCQPPPDPPACAGLRAELQSALLELKTCSAGEASPCATGFGGGCGFSGRCNYAVAPGRDTTALDAIIAEARGPGCGSGSDCGECWGEPLYDCNPESGMCEEVEFHGQVSCDQQAPDPDWQPPSCEDHPGGPYTGDYWLVDTASMDVIACHTSVTGVLHVRSCGLPDLRGLERIISVGGLDVSASSGLTSLTGLSSLGSIAGGLTISNNPDLESLDGVDALASVGGGIAIDNNPVLERIDGLGEVSAAFEIAIWSNPALRSLAGLEGITRVDRVSVGENHGLTDLTGLDGLVDGGISATFSHNAGLATLRGLGSLRTAVNLRIEENASLTSVDGLQAYRSSDNRLIISRSPLLTDLTALAGVTNVIELLVGGNTGLRTLTGLEALHTVEWSIHVADNQQLDDVSALLGVTQFGGGSRAAELRVVNNPNLPQCQADALRDAILPGGGSADLSNNNDQAECP